MPIDPSIALGVRPLEVPNRLAQYGQMAQIEAAQRQGEVSQIQLEELKNDRLEMKNLQNDIASNGGNPDLHDLAARMMKTKAHFTQGYELLQKLREQDKFEVMGRKLYPEMFGGETPTTAAPIRNYAPTGVAPAAAPLGALGSGTFGALPAPVNTLAPAPAPAVNALAAQEKTPDQLRREIMLFSQSADPRAKAFAEILKAQLVESLKAHVVGPNSSLIINGKSVYTGQPAPTETNRLIAERDALITNGVSPNDPRIQAYDQKLASNESQSAKLQRELQTAINNGAPPAVIAQLKRDIVNLHPGLAMQNVVGVDDKGNQIVTRFAGGGGGPAGQFGLNQAPTSTARAMLGLTEADSALLFGPNGPVESGLVPAAKLTPANARMYVAAYKANPTLNLTNLTEDQLQNASKARAKGTIEGRQELTLVDQTTAQNIANGNLPPLNGPGSTKIMNEVMALKPDFRSSDYGLQTSAVKAFNQGKQGDKVRSLNVVMDHFGTLEKAADAVQAGDVRGINAVAQFIQKQTGKPAPTNFDAVKEILADEIVASIVPGVGALADRQAIKKTILAASSPEQIKGIVANYKELIGGQLNGLETQYKAGTGRDDFKSRYLTSAATKGLVSSSNQYVETKTLPDGRVIGKRPDGTLEVVK